MNMKIAIVDPGIPKARFAFNTYGGIIEIPDGRDEYPSTITFHFPTHPKSRGFGMDSEKADERLVNFVRELAKGIGFELKPIKNFRR